ncbi:MAG: hypothetical protein NWQ45_05440, partial [Congregibacter sp.]|nr:hypothetical protein [Congregibacter sp.]
MRLLATRLAPGRSRWLWLGLGVACIVAVVSNPQGFINLWLSPDQQGRLWFAYGDYQRAARSFEDPRWR